MDNANHTDKAFPPEFNHIGMQVKQTQERVQQIDEQIKNVPQNSKPAPALRPPGFVQPKRFDRERIIAGLEHDKSQIKHDMLHRAENEVKEADQATARIVKDNVRESLFPNPFSKMSISEKKAIHNQTRDLEASQDYMDSLFSKQENNAVKADPEEKRTKLSVAAMFIENLSFTKAEKSDVSHNPVKDIDKDIAKD